MSYFPGHSTCHMDSKNPCEHKVIVIGARCVGKTSLIQRYLFNNFHVDVPQTSPEEKKTVTLKTGPINLMICDMTGNRIIYSFDI